MQQRVIIIINHANIYFFYKYIIIGGLFVRPTVQNPKMFSVVMYDEEQQSTVRSLNGQKIGLFN